MKQDPIFSTHAARNNRIKALLKKRNPQQWGQLTVMSFNSTLPKQKIINRIAAEKSYNKIRLEIQHLQQHRSKLHFYLEHPEFICLSELGTLTPQMNICIDWSTTHETYLHHLNNRPQNVNRKMRNCYSAHLSRFKKLSTLASLQQENIELFNALWAAKTKTSPRSNTEQLPAYQTENHTGCHTPMTQPVTAVDESPEITSNSWKKIAQWLSSPHLDSSAERPFLNQEAPQTYQNTLWNQHATSPEKMLLQALPHRNY
ncbi:MAG: hypothetical protein CK426_00180 [Legionella sp.]|nr:MAG: hypothetical protein CK423_06260 [Legionella sp.]PJE00173.1 MAG: hypothetical protein CK426_00180 [Legionella sp.]